MSTSVRAAELQQIRAQRDGFLAFLEEVRRLSPNTVRGYREDLDSYIAWCERNGLTPLCVSRRMLRGYLAELLASGYADKTINRHLSALRTFYAWLEREGVVETSVVGDVPGRKLAKSLPKAMRDSDVLRLIDACDVSVPDGMRDCAMIELLYASGARISELAGLKPTDIDYRQQQVRLFGKGSKERIVPLYPAALEAVGSYMRDARPALLSKSRAENLAPMLFISSRGNNMSADMLRKRFNRLVKLAGVDGTVTPHAMRHTFATELLNGGADLQAVQELLGHESLDTTQIYTHLSVDRLKQATRLAHPRA